ncbi:LOG family protein [Schlesneria paludicola]|uniref:LOG family protein n=1 Tax=Schlesneria paludicola TaxID=360056 RepID=UPI00059007D0|nr:TIGR00730 family Rossman fold protein [Schlesneria paludicola]
MDEKNKPGDRIVCVYCASSSACHPQYHEAAYRLGELLAENGCSIVYGGGAVGSMGAVADGALSKQGKVVGVIPEFMVKLEWEHPGVTELLRVEDMRTRKHLMLSKSHAVVALPGGTGTLEELFEAITLKRLGLYLHPIVLLNTRGFYDPLIELLDRAITERFLGEKHATMWQVVNEPEEVFSAITGAPEWPSDAIAFAAQK